MHSFQALLLYLTGDKGLCNSCRKGGQTFDACIGLRNPSPVLKEAFASACCNCYFREDMRPCAVVYSMQPDDEEERPEIPKVTPVPVPVFPRRQPKRAAAPAHTTQAPTAPVSIAAPDIAAPDSQLDVGNMPANSLIELEDWELAPGRIRDEAQGNPESKYLPRQV